MKKKFYFLLLICLIIPGCGDFEWFPSDTNKPLLSKAFSTTTQTIGNPVTLTFTITNAEGSAAQSELGFTDNLPGGTQNSTVGMFVANPPNVTSTCGGTVFTGGTTNPVTPGDTSFTFSGGSIGAGPSTCTVSIQVTSNASTSNLNQSFVNGFSNITNVTGNLINNVTNQLVAFSPVTLAIPNGILSARDLVVNPTGTPQFSLFVDNTGVSTNVTVTLIGKDAAGTQITELKVPDPAIGPALIPFGTTQQLTLNGVTVDSTIKTWQITTITTQ
jgi:hypothetical protein